MSIKGNEIKFTKAPDIDQVSKDPSGGAEDIRNFRVDPNGGGWLADRGLESWWSAFAESPLQMAKTGFEYTFLTEKVDRLFVWSKQNTEQTYTIVEQAGYLYYLVGNKGAYTGTAFQNDVVILDSGRHRPKENEPGTQFIPFGNRLLILNGYNKPIWFYGREKLRDFSFLLPTPEVEVIGIDPSYLSASTPSLKQSTAAPNFENQTIGLGDVGINNFNSYSYRMTFISDTGSESPLGPISNVSWLIGSDAAETVKFGVFLSDIPLGPKGTVARKIYRTKNQRISYASDSRDQLFYESLTIKDNSSYQVIDIIPDNALTIEAPALTDSTVISSSYQFGESWDGRIWLAGGSSHPTKIIYSEKGLPEQFAAFNYFDVGNTQGGAITQVYAYYNNLLVFRESSIDIIRNNNGNYTMSQLSPNIGTIASNTIQLVPDAGVLFLSKEGFFGLNGGLDGGSSINVVKISNKFNKEIQKINKSALAKSWAVYSRKEKEYWCHYPRRGSDYPTRGIVYHSQTGQVSFRGSTVKNAEFKWRFTAGTTDKNGYIIFGTSPTWRKLGASSNPGVVNAKGYLVGLQVWSGATYWSEIWQATTIGDNGNTFTITKDVLQENVWESNWFDFGAPAIKHRAFAVELEMIAYGDNPIELEYGYDYDSTWTSAGTQKVTKSELVYTTSEDPVFGQDASITKSPFTVGTSAVKGERVVIIRFDVNTTLVDSFRWKIKSSKPYQLLGYTLITNSRDQKPLNQRAGINRGAY